jgi:hypothetical protein
MTKNTQKQPRKAALLLLALVFSLGSLQACDQAGASSGSPDPAPAPAPTPDPSPLPSTLYRGTEGLEKYVLKFIDDAKAQGIDVVPELTNPQLEIQIASLNAWGSSVIGLCQTGSGTRKVTFDPDFWNSVSETQREQLAHHELGHCMLYRGHRSTLLTTGKPASLMYPSIFSSSTYMADYDYYQAELFGQAMVEASSSLVDETGQVRASDRLTPRVHICKPTSEPDTTPPAEGA